MLHQKSQKVAIPLVVIRPSIIAASFAEPVPGWTDSLGLIGGFYSSEIEDINGVHNLEHGFIWITYRNVSAETKARLKKIANRYSGRVVASERRANDAQITLASWGRFDKMSQEELDEDYVIRFIDKYTNKSPERLAK